MIYKFFFFILSNFTLWIVDNIIAKKLNHRWFCLHAFANLVITITSISGLINSLNDPINAMNSLVYLESNDIISPSSSIPICMINAIHFYHVVFFNLNKEDTFHHFLFGLFIGLPGFYYHWGALRNFLSFTICGFPGLIDYTNLLLVKQNLMLKQTQKKICSFLNCWIRAPLIILDVFMHFIAFKYSTTTVPLPINILVGVLGFYNGLHYLQSSIRSEERYNFKLIYNKTQKK